MRRESGGAWMRSGATHPPTRLMPPSIDERRHVVINTVIEYHSDMDNQVPAGELGRLLAARRRRVTGTCPVCGATFTGIGKRRYCSDRCRFRATYLRRKGNGAAREEDQP